MSEPIRHHFVPQFYLREWCRADGRIPFSMRSKNGEIYQSYVLPDMTAFENRLYSYEKVPLDQRQAVEKLFFATEVDDKAALVHRKLIGGSVNKLTVEEREIWTRFLIASRLRVPEIVKDLKASATTELRRRLTEDPEEFLAIIGANSKDTLLAWTERTFIGLRNGKRIRLNLCSGVLRHEH